MSTMSMGLAGPSRTGEGSARGVRLALGAAATVLLAGSSYAAIAMDGAATDVAPSARLAAEAAAPAVAPLPAPPSPVAVAVPVAPAVDPGRPVAPERTTSASTVQDAPARHSSSAGVTHAERPVARPSTPSVGHAVERPHHIDRPRDHDTAADRYRTQLRQQTRAEMRREAREYVAEHWHMPMTP